MRLWREFVWVDGKSVREEKKRRKHRQQVVFMTVAVGILSHATAPVARLCVFARRWPVFAGVLLGVVCLTLLSGGPKACRALVLLEFL